MLHFQTLTQTLKNEKVDNHNEAVNLCFITDENFAMQTGVAITSIIKNKIKTNLYHIYIICTEVCEDTKNKLKNLEKK